MENYKTLKELLHELPRHKRFKYFWEAAELLSEQIEQLDITKEQHDEIIKNIDDLIRSTEKHSYTKGFEIAEVKANAVLRQFIEKIGNGEPVENIIIDIKKTESSI